ncbi:MAG TPA: N-acetylneuraminate synthase [Hadesarchaea archaeon]|nr:N-acetylneuraminate synthase [Hadesarchaea archaeon]
MKNIRIGKKMIGEGQSTFIIAEIASAHQGDLGLLTELIDKVHNTGADAVKFQKFITEELVTPSGPRYENFKRIEFTEKTWGRVLDSACKFKWEILADVFDEKSCDFMDELGVSAFKIHSTDLTNPYMTSHTAKKGKPILLSTGGSTMKEIENAIEMIKSHGNHDIILVHGFQAYPTLIEDTNLKMIPKLKRIFNLNVGFHDHVDAEHELATFLPCLAVTMGASVIEKHVTLERESKGLDYESSLTPEEFKKMVQNIRNTEKILGSGEFELSDAMKKYRDEVKKNIVARVDIPAESKIELHMLAFKRSAPGLPPSEAVKIIGKRTKTSIKKDEIITWDKLS